MTLFLLSEAGLGSRKGCSGTVVARRPGRYGTVDSRSVASETENRSPSGPRGLVVVIRYYPSEQMPDAWHSRMGRQVGLPFAYPGEHA